VGSQPLHDPSAGSAGNHFSFFFTLQLSQVLIARILVIAGTLHPHYHCAGGVCCCCAPCTADHAAAPQLQRQLNKAQHALQQLVRQVAAGGGAAALLCLGSGGRTAAVLPLSLQLQSGKLLLQLAGQGPLQD
jgi:hypothetical protein